MLIPKYFFQILTALRFYAVGCYQGAIGEQWDIAVSQPSVSRCIRKVTDAINDLLLRRWVKFPMTDMERHAAREKFRTAAQPFPGAIGAIDCTYINIKGPKEHEKAYVNHWSDHTINAQLVRIIYILKFSQYNYNLKYKINKSFFKFSIPKSIFCNHNFRSVIPS